MVSTHAYAYIHRSLQEALTMSESKKSCSSAGSVDPIVTALKECNLLSSMSAAGVHVLIATS
jgi:hypothetical protein